MVFWKIFNANRGPCNFYFFRKWRWKVGRFLYLYGVASETITAVIAVFSAMIELFLFALVLILGSLKSVQYLRWLRSPFVKTINQIPGPGMLPILGSIPSIPRNTDGKWFSILKKYLIYYLKLLCRTFTADAKQTRSEIWFNFPNMDMVASVCPNFFTNFYWGN